MKRLPKKRTDWRWLGTVVPAPVYLAAHRLADRRKIAVNRLLKELVLQALDQEQAR
jgi:hypothetical protein